MQSIRHTSHSSLPSPQRDTGDARHCPPDRSADSARGKGLLCPPKGNSNLSLLWCSAQRQNRRGLGAVRLGATQHPVYAGYLSCGIAAQRSADAGTAGGRLRRHDNPSGGHACFHWAPRPVDPRWIPPAQAARLQPHLFGSPGAQALDSPRCYGESPYGLGAASALETRM